MPDGGVITQLALRVDESNRNEFSGTIPALEVRMATASSLSPVITQNFNENIGPGGEQVVFPRGSLNFTIKPSTGPANPFSITIPLATPFTYDPRNGGLVVDLFTHGG